LRAATGPPIFGYPNWQRCGDAGPIETGATPGAPSQPGARSFAASANSPLKIREVDGKAWIVSARISTGTRARIARTHSWIAADESGQAIAAPINWRVARSKVTVTCPNSASTA